MIARDLDECEACQDFTLRFEDSGRCVPCNLRVARDAILALRRPANARGGDRRCTTCGDMRRPGGCKRCRKVKLAALFTGNVPCAPCGGIVDRTPSGACRSCQRRAKGAA
jgi:hypothetical protein